MNSLAERLRQARKEKGLTQQEVAVRAGTTQDIVQKIENKKILRPRNIEDIARAVDRSPAWLLFGVEALDSLDSESVQFAVDYANLPEDQKAIIKATLQAVKNTKSG